MGATELAPLVQNSHVNIRAPVHGAAGTRHRRPERFSVAGFDALEVLPSTGTLTSVRRATEQMGRQAVQLLVERMRRPSAPPQHVRLPTALVVGNTAGQLDLVPERR